MTNSTQVYWEANGLSLHTYAWAVASWGGSRQQPPSKRGDNLTIPFKRGQIYVPKIRDARIISLGMWMLPMNQDGTRDVTMTLEQKLHANWQTIVNAIDTEDQITLTKRWWVNTSVVSASALAEWVDGLDPDMSTTYRPEFSIDFLLTDPYFYGSPVSQAIGNITNAPGDVPTDHVTLTLNSGTNPRVTFADGNWVQFNGSVGTAVVIDVAKASATQGGVYVNGLITRNPNFPSWPKVKPGANAISLSSGSGTIQFSPAYR